MAARSDQVIVVGAGPTGLALAGELALAGVPCRVFERRTARTRDSRAICLHARSMEMLALRGRAGVFVDAGLPVRSFPLGLRGSAIDLRRLDSDFPYILDIPQNKIEELLEQRAVELGAEIVRSSTVVGVEQADDEVLVTVEGPDGSRVERAAYAVGCDGLRSAVREALDVPFPGFNNPGSVALADVHLDGLPMDDAYGDLSDAGMLLVFPFQDGSCRVVLYDYSRADAPTSEPVGLDEVGESLARVTGRSDLVPRDMYWSSRYRSESRQAPAYRAGRVFLAGDAAHTHSPAGAQGLNTGFQDAFNLGWKLAAAIKGRAPDWLLDTYHAERHPVGRDVLTLTGRQFRLNTARTWQHRVLRWVAYRLIVPLPPAQDWLGRNYSGTAVSYRGSDTRHTHPLEGARLPSVTLTLPGGSRTRLYDLFADGHFVLLDRDFHAERYGGLPEHVRTIPYLRCDRPRWPAAALIRPDGYVAWAHDEDDPALRAPMVRQAVQAWCSPAASRLNS
ncbi:MAG TPA: FAD-dependent monooxygenase [Streptosporangiaceae bacterium]|jgi:2-polyprenyl-6-methoxyphenol hydroxylase-like FAD-dependent oxidoreductase